MARRHCYDYPRPALTVDLGVFCLDGNALRILLIRRRHDPFAGHWALPGGFLELDETIPAAALRELREETGFIVPEAHFLGIYGDPGRDPRGRTISVAHVATHRGPPPAVAGGDDAADAAWLDPSSSLELAFDHAAILRAALSWLGAEVDRGGRAAFGLLPEEFTGGDTARLFRALGRPTRVSQAWCKRLEIEGRLARSQGRAVRFRPTNSPHAPVEQAD